MEMQSSVIAQWEEKARKDRNKDGEERRKKRGSYYPKFQSHDNLLCQFYSINNIMPLDSCRIVYMRNT
jgi:hypothetical protein